MFLSGGKNWYKMWFVFPDILEKSFSSFLSSRETMLKSESLLQYPHRFAFFRTDSSLDLSALDAKPAHADEAYNSFVTTVD